MRTFWSIAFINLFLATVYLVSALWVTFNPASGCTVDGQPCRSFGAGTLMLYIGGPVLVAVLAVFVASRLRRARPVITLGLVLLPLLVVIAMMAFRLVG